MRGVAAVCVMLYHYGDLLPSIGGIRAFEAGNFAVDLFFVLSGFVIAFAYGRRIAAGMPFARSSFFG